MNLFGGVGSSRHTEDLTLTASGASVLTTDSVTPVVTDTSVTTNLLHSLDVVTDTCNEVVDGKVHGLASGEILLSVDEPVGHLELLGVHDDSDELLHLF